jgi:hypothetical protein
VQLVTFSYAPRQSLTVRSAARPLFALPRGRPNVVKGCLDLNDALKDQIDVVAILLDARLEFVDEVSKPQALSAFRLTFSAALVSFWHGSLLRHV